MDAVVDEEQGPLILEVNAHPGLEMRNVAGVGLAELLSSTESPTTTEPLGFALTGSGLR